ncbi:MAG: GAF domain-containing protein [Candidatus Methylomirabilales bacterium]
MELSWSRLRGLTIWAPVAFIAVLELLVLSLHPSHLSHQATFLLTMGVVLIGAYLFSHFVFAIIRKKEQEVLRRTLELSALSAVGAVVSESLDLDKILHQALDKVLEVTEAQAAEIFLWEEEAQALILRAHRGLFPQAFQEIPHFKMGEGIPGQVARSGEALVVSNIVEDPRFLRKGVREKGFRSLVSVPLKAKNQVLGVMNVAAFDSQQLTLEDVQLLLALGNQIGVAIENSRLLEQLQRLVVLEERDRISKDLHDGVIQSIYAIGLRLEECCDSVKEETIRARLEQAIADLNGVIRDIRNYISSLRPFLFDGRGLSGSLADLVKAFKAGTSIKAELVIADGIEGQLSQDRAIHLFHIAQEALANIVRHARAGSVLIHLFQAEDHLVLSIQDDGIGFDPEEVKKGEGQGLRNMADRARLLQGRFKVESAPGKGTSIVVAIPLIEEGG